MDSIFLEDNAQTDVEETDLADKILEITLRAGDEYSDTRRMLLNDHPSIHSNLNSAAEYLQKNFPFCALCSGGNIFENEAVLQDHARDLHINEGILSSDYVLLHCNLHCQMENKIKQEEECPPHFHCPYCGCIFLTANAITKHITKHTIIGDNQSRFRKRPRKEYEPKPNWAKHPSIAPSIKSFMKSLRLPYCKLCFYHIKFMKSKSLIFHTEKAHVSKALVSKRFCVMACLKHCHNFSSYHYHCPKCDYINSRRLEYVHHIRSHPEFKSIKLSLVNSSNYKVLWYGKPNIKIEAVSSHNENFELINVDTVKSEMVNDLDMSKQYRELLIDGDDADVIVKQEIDIEEENNVISIEDESSCKKTQSEESESFSSSIKNSLQEAFDCIDTPSCYLCCLEFEGRLYMEVHFYRYHIRHAICTDKAVLLVCNRNCNAINARHYHCHVCDFISDHKDDMKRHVNEHEEKTTEDKIELGDVNCSLPDLLKKLLEMEVEAEWSTVLSSSHTFSPPPSLLTNALSLYDSVKPLHCVLCHDGREYRVYSKLQTHFITSHLKRANTWCPLPSLMCRLSCNGLMRGHYHCNFCVLVTHDLKKMKIHQSRLHKDLIEKAHLCLLKGLSIDFSTRNSEQRKEEEVKKCMGEFIRDNSRFKTTGDYTRHVSICRSLEELNAHSYFPDCILCSEKKMFISHELLSKHLHSAHINRGFAASELLVLCCKRRSEKYEQGGHYHCPWCLFIHRDKRKAYEHVLKHQKSKAEEDVKKDALAIADRENPVTMEQFKVDLSGVSPQDIPQIEKWQREFNSFLLSEVHGTSLKRELKLLSYKRMRDIVNHLQFGTELHRFSMYYITFKNYKVCTVPELGLKNCLVVPKVDYTFQDEPTDIEDQFYCRYRRVVCMEEFFKILFYIHVQLPEEEQLEGGHLSVVRMIPEVRRRFEIVPQMVVRRFVNLCPFCANQPDENVVRRLPTYSDFPAAVFTDDLDGRPLVQASRFMTILLVNLVDMSDNPDGCYNYIVHCQDRHTLLHVLFPLCNLDMEEVARGVVRHLLSITGLPSVIVSDSGQEFVKRLITHVSEVWPEPCGSVLANSSPDSVTRLCLPRIDSSDVIEDLSKVILANAKLGIPNNWSNWLKQLQYRLNLKSSLPELSPYQQTFHKAASVPEKSASHPDEKL